MILVVSTFKKASKVRIPDRESDGEPDGGPEGVTTPYPVPKFEHIFLVNPELLHLDSIRGDSHEVLRYR